jgi:Holliday junction resolvase RusA-like endonuclease
MVERQDCVVIISRGTIQGTLPSMKNQRQIARNRKTKAPMLIKSAKARAYVGLALSQILHRERVNCVADVALTAYIYYPDRRHDVDGELLCDILQQAQVVKNDRQIRVKHFEGYIDKLNPRVEWQIETLE